MSTVWPDRVFFTMAHYPEGPQRIGPPYTTRATAESWVSFVRKARRVRRVTVQACKLEVDASGKLTSATLERLDKVFNLDPPDDG